MSRSISSALQTHIEGQQIRGGVTLVKLEYASGTTFYNSGDRDITFDGDTYLAVGSSGKISIVEESSQLQANGVELQLSGIDTTNISAALTENYQGRKCYVYNAFFDSNYAVISDPLLIFKGRMNTQDIVIGFEATITVSCESILVDWERPRVQRFNHEDQLQKYPTDKGFEFTAQTVEKEIIWPGKQ